MSKYFAKKGKEPKKMGRDPRSDAPPLPGRSPYSGNTLPPKPLNSTKPGYSSEAIEPQLPQRTTNPYPGTWKPPKAPVPLPQEPCLPKSTSTGSFDDEYVAPGELQDGGNDMFGGKQMTSYPTHQPSTPPLSGDEDYAAPDDINHGRTNVTNGYSSNYHAYKQQQVAPSTPPLETSDSEDLYIAPDGEDTYDAPDTDQIISPYHAQRMNYPGPSTPPLKPSDTEDLYMGPDDDREETYDAPDDCIMPAYPTQRMNYQSRSTPPLPVEPDEDYDTPDNLNPAATTYPPPDPLIEDSYDLPDNLQLGGGHTRGPSTPPLPVTPPLDTEDTYDVPDREEEFVPPSFAPPKFPHFKPQYNTPSYLQNNNPEPKKPSAPVNELTKRFAAFAPKPDVSPAHAPPPLSPTKPSTRKPNISTPAFKPTQPPPTPQNTRLEEQVWFKNTFDRHLSESFLRQYNKDGGFVVRPSTKEGAGNYSFSIYYQGEIRHLKLRKKINNKYSVGEEKENELEFESVSDCVKYHRTEPLILKAGGEVCLEVLQ